MTSFYLFIFLFLLFSLGGIGIMLANQKKRKCERRDSWIKYFVYFLIVNTLFASITYCPSLFSVFCVLIVLGGCFELIRLQHSSHQLSYSEFSIFLTAYIALSVLFCLFGFWEQDTQLFTLLIVCSFDAFSQLSGQLFGKRKICPRISPAKMVGGTIGGTIISMIVCLIAGCNMGWKINTALVSGLVIVGASFIGDLAASYVKRRFGVKDFGQIFPGHGGFLDRFDSLILAGTFMYLLQWCYR